MIDTFRLGAAAVIVLTVLAVLVPVAFLVQLARDVWMDLRHGIADEKGVRPR
jgi:hypothetical protein